MKQRNRSSRRKQRPAGHKLWRKVLKAQYGKAWREYAALD